MFWFAKNKTSDENNKKKTLPEKQNSSGFISGFKNKIDAVLKYGKKFKMPKFEDIPEDKIIEGIGNIEINYKGYTLLLELNLNNLKLVNWGGVISLFDEDGKNLVEASFDMIEKYITNRLEKGKIFYKNGKIEINVKKSPDECFVNFFSVGKRFGSIPNLSKKEMVDREIRNILKERSRTHILKEDEIHGIAQKFGLPTQESHAKEFDEFLKESDKHKKGTEEKVEIIEEYKEPETEILLTDEGIEQSKLELYKIKKEELKNEQERIEKLSQEGKEFKILETEIIPDLSLELFEIKGDEDEVVELIEEVKGDEDEVVELNDKIKIFGQDEEFNYLDMVNLINDIEEELRKEVKDDFSLNLLELNYVWEIEKLEKMIKKSKEKITIQEDNGEITNEKTSAQYEPFNLLEDNKENIINEPGEPDIDLIEKINIDFVGGAYYKSKLKSSDTHQIFIKSVIADTKKSIEPLIENKAKKEFQKIYNSSSKIGKIFLSMKQKSKIKNIIKKLNSKSKLELNNCFSETKNIASDRIYKDKLEFLDTTIDTIGKWKNGEINNLATEYIEGKINESFFWTRFEQIINVSGERKIDKMNHKGTNIMMLLNMEKDYQDLLNQVKNVMNGDYEDKDGEIFELFKKFANNIEKLMFFVETSGIDLNEKDYKNPTPKDDEFEERAIDFLKQTYGDKRELNIEFDILESGKGAFQMTHNDRKKGVQYKIGETINNNPIKSLLLMSSGIILSSIAAGQVDNLSFLNSETINHILSTAKISSFNNLAIGSIGFGVLNYLKSFASYTDRQEIFEQNIVLGKEDNIFNEINTITKQEEKSNFVMKKFYSWKKNNLKKELEKYEGKKDAIELIFGAKPTHDNFIDIDSLIKDIGNCFDKNMTSEEVDENTLEEIIAKAVARIELWKKTGHNFLKCTNGENIEHKQKELYDLIIIALNRLGFSYYNFIKTNYVYLNTKNELLEEYKESSKAFRSIRRKNAFKKGLISSSVFATSNILGQYLSHSSLFTKEIPGSIITETKVNIDNDIILNLIKNNGIDINNKNAVIEFLNRNSFEVSGNKIYQTVTNFKPEVSNKLQILLGNNYEKFISAIKDTQNHSTLWEILTKQVFKNTKLGNEAKNKILELMLDGTNNDLINNLTQEASKNGLFDVIGNQSRVLKICKTLKYWGYNVKKEWIIEKISAIQSGTLDYNTLNIGEKRKLGEILWTFIGKNSGDNQIISNIFETTTKSVKESITNQVGNIITTTNVTEQAPIIIEKASWLKHFGIPWLSKKEK